VTIAEQIKAARTMAGWSQERLARHLGVAANTVAVQERGEVAWTAGTVWPDNLYTRTLRKWIEEVEETSP